MLEMEAVDGEDLKMQMVTALRSTAAGKDMHIRLCDRLSALRELVSTLPY